MYGRYDFKKQKAYGKETERKKVNENDFCNNCSNLQSEHMTNLITTFVCYVEIKLGKETKFTQSVLNLLRS